MRSFDAHAGFTEYILYRTDNSQQYVSHTASALNRIHPGLLSAPVNAKQIKRYMYMQLITTNIMVKQGQPCFWWTEFQLELTSNSNLCEHTSNCQPDTESYPSMSATRTFNDKVYLYGSEFTRSPHFLTSFCSLILNVLLLFAQKCSFWKRILIIQLDGAVRWERDTIMYRPPPDRLTCVGRWGDDRGIKQ